MFTIQTVANRANNCADSPLKPPTFGSKKCFTNTPGTAGALFHKSKEQRQLTRVLQRATPQSRLV